MAKKFYWMKLREDFFDDDAMEWLEEQPKGKEYALFYLKLCLKSLKTNGLLIRTVGTLLVPYDTVKLAEITKTDFDTVVVAMELLKNIGLVEILEGGEICIPRMEEMIGSETDKASIMRRIREQKRMLEGNNITEMLPERYLHNGGNNVTGELPDCYQNVTQRLEIRDREREKELIVAPPGNGSSTDPSGASEKNPVGDFEYQCVDMLVRSCVAVFPNSKVPKTEADKRKWAVEIERMKRLDGRAEADIIEALTFATTDGFWKSNIRSTKKFREKFETLIVQSRAKQGRNARQGYGNQFNQFQRQDYDIAELERSLVENVRKEGS
ncbi:phage replisome organizer N-terminal domain-containing protein [Acetatifactor aquisgranensis]|uniref:phage replisome organizer N-terminal domain-containing protein n=1 Tax=Acetatifactor aquisgranensis TaxID=2941233 RepID=UPI00203DF6CC|nr:phage replisome organizer N-terminal domain-containing protein [Acetatifactor aquisgranensis]